MINILNEDIVYVCLFKISMVCCFILLFVSFFNLVMKFSNVSDVIVYFW